jgi:TRAP-type mannitol/chloroaromatic compound transport system permease small subunit
MGIFTDPGGVERSFRVRCLLPKGIKMEEFSAEEVIQSMDAGLFARFIHGFMGVMNAIGTAWVGVITVLISCDIIGRVAFNSPIIGVPEIVKVSIVAIAWMQMAHTLKIGAHLRSEIILDRLPSRGKAIVNLLAYGMGAFIFAMLVYSAWPNMIEAWRVGEFEGELPVRVPTYPVRTILILGAALTSIQFLLFLVQTIRSLVNPVGKGKK